MQYFTADTHFNHKNIITFCNRPWPNVEEMNKGMIDRWNSVVKSDDTVMHLGDFFFGSPSTIPPIIQALNGNIFLIRGNHDYSKYLQPMKDNGVGIYDDQIVELYGGHLVLCHYPLASWNHDFHGSVHFHGHKHGTLTEYVSNRFDVGVDCHDFFPKTLEQIVSQTK